MDSMHVPFTTRHHEIMRLQQSIDEMFGEETYYAKVDHDLPDRAHIGGILQRECREPADRSGGAQGLSERRGGVRTRGPVASNRPGPISLRLLSWRSLRCFDI